MAYAVAYMRSILGSILPLVMLYIFSLSVSFLGPSPPPPPPPRRLFDADDSFLGTSRGFCDTLIF